MSHHPFLAFGQMVCLQHSAVIAKQTSPSNVQRSSCFGAACKRLVIVVQLVFCNRKSTQAHDLNYSIKTANTMVTLYFMGAVIS